MVQEKNIKKINYKLIKSTASELFLQKGYGNTSMNDIAVHLNIKKASLYHHIKSRSQLVLDIVNDLERKLFEIFNRLQSLTDFNEQKKLFLDTAKCFYIDTEHSYLILILAHETADETVKKTANVFIQHWIQQLKQLLNQQTRTSNAQQLATNTIHLLTGSLINNKIANKKQTALKLFKQLDPLFD